MRAWLKGGLILGAIWLLLNIILFVVAILWVAITKPEEFGGLMPLVVIIIFAWGIIPSIVIGMVIGAIIGYFAKRQMSYLSIGWKSGIWIGLILGILVWVLFAVFDSFYEATHTPAVIISPFIVLIICTVVGAIIGLIISKIKQRKQLQVISK